MGPYHTLNAVFVGFFGFAAIYHFVLWWQSRREAILLVFALHCALCASLSACLLVLVTVRTTPDGQQALNLRLELAALAQISQVWLLSLISGVRARWYVLFITAVFLTVAVANLAVPMTGTVTGVERIFTSWGEPISILNRDAPSRWLGIVYALSLSINIFGFICVQGLRQTLVDAADVGELGEAATAQQALDLVRQQVGTRSCSISGSLDAAASKS